MNPYIIVLGIGCVTKQPPPSDNTILNQQEATEATEATEADTDGTDGTDGTDKPEETSMKEISGYPSYNPPTPTSPAIRTVNPPPLNVPQPPPTPSNQLLRWDDVMPPDDMPSGTPTPGLALSSNHEICYKEWFAERSVHPHVRRYGGRILLPDETANGPRILCSQAEKTAVLSKLIEAGIVPPLSK